MDQTCFQVTTKFVLRVYAYLIKASIYFECDFFQHVCRSAGIWSDPVSSRNVMVTITEIFELERYACLSKKKLEKYLDFDQCQTAQTQMLREYELMSVYHSARSGGIIGIYF